MFLVQTNKNRSMIGKKITAELSYKVHVVQYHTTHIELDIPEDYNMVQFSLQDFEADIKDQVEDNFWSGNSQIQDQETNDFEIEIY